MSFGISPKLTLTAKAELVDDRSLETACMAE